MTHPNFTITVLLHVWEADCSLSFLLKGAETLRFLHFTMLNAKKQANSHPNLSGEWGAAEGMRIKKGRGGGVNSSHIYCRGNCLADHSTVTLQLILFVSYYLSSSKFVKLSL